MAEPGIPEDVRRFVGEEIHSVDQLEILLELQRRAPEWWTADGVANELRTSASSVAARMADMAGRGLLEREEGSARYRFRPAKATVEHVVQRLGRLYSERRVSMITLIFSKAQDSIRDFSNAFRIRGEGE